jgi:N6-L-threonylcarbamoyladenine synthase
MLDADPCTYPALGLVVSGGHTSLYLVRGPLEFELLGRTIDDAVGEAYDKAATILQLGYPGGPALDRLASKGNERAHDFPIASMSRDSLDFSYSGLKTALLYAVCGTPVGRGADARLPRDATHYSEAEIADFAASFQRAAITAVMKKVKRALDGHSEIGTLLVGGGVAANSRLRAELKALADECGLDLRLPDMQFCMDNAAMIAGLAAKRWEADDFDDLTLSAAARSEI